jgi:flavin-binding protein dodecin
VTVDLTGSTPPSSTTSIAKAIRDAAGRPISVQVRFVERQVLK